MGNVITLSIQETYHIMHVHTVWSVFCFPFSSFFFFFFFLVFLSYDKWRNIYISLAERKTDVTTYFSQNDFLHNFNPKWVIHHL